MDELSIDKIEKALGEIDTISKDLEATRQEFKGTIKKLYDIDEISRDVKGILTQSKDTILDLEKQRILLEEEKKQKEETISQLTDEQKKILERYGELESQMKKFSNIVKEFEEKEFDFDDVKAMLSIFSVLLEKIFQGQPHARILYTLHGGASEMSREKLKKTTGISGAMVLRAVHELAREGLVEFDEDTDNVKLTVRIY